MGRQNRRFCTLPDISSPNTVNTVDKNTDCIDPSMIMKTDSNLSEHSTSYLFQRVQSSSRRRYRVLLSLVSTMVMMSTAVAIISITIKKMTTKHERTNGKDELWFDRHTLAPGVSSPSPTADTLFVANDDVATNSNNQDTLSHTPPTPPNDTPFDDDDDDDVDQQNLSPPAPAAPADEGGLLEFFPPLSTFRQTEPPSAAPSETIIQEQKRPSVSDLTKAPIPPTPAPTIIPTMSVPPTGDPTWTPTTPPTFEPTTEEPTVITVDGEEFAVPSPKPARAPFSPFLDIVRPAPQQPATAPPISTLGRPRPGQDDDDEGDDNGGDDDTELDMPNGGVANTLMPTFAPTKQRKMRRTTAPTSEPTETPTPKPTRRPRRTMSPSAAPTTLEPTREAPVASTVAPIITTPLDRMEEPTLEPTRETDEPTLEPTRETVEPTRATDEPTKSPVSDPTVEPTKIPVSDPTQEPTKMPQTDKPTEEPSAGLVVDDAVADLTPVPQEEMEEVVVDDDNLGNDFISYSPGLLTQMEAGLRLSKGLTARLIAKTGSKVEYGNGDLSEALFHGRPDAGATFPDTRPFNKGGWIYVTNSEMRTQDPPGGDENGGVGAITFDRRGNILKYEMILSKTKWNCGGGKTPWGTWVSCEEHPRGIIWQVDPFSNREPEILTMGKKGGSWESFTYDIRDMNAPHFFVTEDRVTGAMMRYTPQPSEVNWQEPWSMLHGNGTTEFLLLTPDATGEKGTYEWTLDESKAQSNAARHYPNCEGIDSNGDSVYFVSKRRKELFELNLRDNTYTRVSTVRGLFDGKPDQVARIITQGVGESYEDDILYFTEEGGTESGVHGRDLKGNFYTILESPNFSKETSGLAFSPDGRHLYIAFQEDGALFDVSRQDGMPFHAKTLNVKYHAIS